jgi:hypothetical protein
MKYNICVVRPDGYIHAGAFTELAELLACGLADLGHAVALSSNRTFPDARNILIGCHLLDPVHIARVPADSIVLNTEQLDHDNAVWSHNVFAWASCFETWDYRLRNLLRLATVCARPPRHLRLGYHARLARIPRGQPRDIDVLFYGVVGERRQRALDAVAAAGLQLRTVFGIYGAARDALIARSRVVLNLHHYDARIFEAVRVFYLLTNARAVVGEVGPDTEIDDVCRAGIRGVPFEALAEACAALVADPVQCAALETRALDSIRRFPQHELLRPLLA